MSIENSGSILGLRCVPPAQQDHSPQNLDMAQLIETYAMGPVNSCSTSVLHESYDADNEEDRKALVGSEPEDASQEAARPSNSRLISCFRWWLPELFASLLSVGSFISLAATARIYHGRDFHDTNLLPSLSLNSLIALLSTLNRVALMVPVGSAMSQEVWLWFYDAQRSSSSHAQLRDLEISDAASRGAWGNLLFLLRTRPRYLAQFCALVTICSFLFGTSTQQLIGYVDFPTTENTLQPGNIDHIESWVNYTSGNNDLGASIPLTLKGATYNGIFTPNIQPLAASCPTGNCTWPRTPSLAICGSCSKVAYQLSYETIDLPLLLGDVTPGYAPLQFQHNYSIYNMPSGNVANLTRFVTGLEDGTGFQVMSTPLNINSTNNTDILYLTKFDLVGAPANTYAHPLQNSSTIAAECSLWFCVQAYDTQVANTKQTQNITYSFSQIANSSIDEEDLWITFLQLPAEMNPVPDGIYKVATLETLAAFDSFLGPLFNGTVILHETFNQPSSDAIQAIWNATSLDVDAWIKNIALSMTNALRAFDPTTNDLYDGEGLHLGVQVRWRWIILPAALVTSSLIISVATIIRTARSPVQAWKGSPLVLLFTNLDQDLTNGAEGRMDALNGLQDSVGRTKVVLKGGRKGNWAFKTA